MDLMAEHLPFELVTLLVIKCLCLLHALPPLALASLQRFRIALFSVLSSTLFIALA